MRISTKKDDDGYKKDFADYTITLDGQPVNNCIAADDKEGMVLVNAMSRHNKPNPKILRGNVGVTKKSLKAGRVSRPGGLDEDNDAFEDADSDGG